MKRIKHIPMILFLLFALILAAGTAQAAAKAPKKIKLNKSKLTMYVGEKYTLKPTFTPKKANTKVKWTTSKKSIVTVSSKGRLQAKKAGKAVITCTSKANSKIKAKCTVTVKKPVALKKLAIYDKAKGFELSGGILLEVGFDYTPEAKLTPANATYKDVKWSSSDPAVFTVDKNGKCTGVGAGTAVLACTSVKYPKIKAECPVEVMKPKNLRDDEELLAKTKNILSRTCQPLYLKLQGDSPSYKDDPDGRTIWSISPNTNGTIKYIYAYEPGTYNIIGATYCMYSSPVITLNDNTPSPSDVRTALRDGTYDFAADPAEVTIGWSMWNGETTKEALQKTLNTKISDDIYNELIKKATSWTTTRAGGSAIIVYGKNAAGDLCAKYAGSISYNMASNAAVYNLVGVDPENEEIYGKAFNGTAVY